MKNKTPRLLQGFNDYYSDNVRIREYIKNTFRKYFELYGYEPLETPALEFSDLMLGQSGEDAEKQYYRFKDNGDRDVMLKFELMISMCRSIAQNINTITFPYKRYQIQNVWRAEKVQKGREREFTQIDADVIGSDSILAEGEYLDMSIKTLLELGIGDFVLRINNRKFLEGLVRNFDISEVNMYGVFMSIDKLEKKGRDEVLKELTDIRGIERKTASEILASIIDNEYSQNTPLELINYFKNTYTENRLLNEGLNELEQIFTYLNACNVDPKFVRFDPTIARGLASYTGPVWEFSVPNSNVGSIGGGGRYDNAISKYVGKILPSTGGSFGLERLSEIIKDRNLLEIENPTKLLFTNFSEEMLLDSIALLNRLRDAGIPTMLYPEVAKLDKQIKYALKKDIPYLLIYGPDEKAENKVVLKDLKNQTQIKMDVPELLEKFMN